MKSVHSLGVVHFRRNRGIGPQIFVYPIVTLENYRNSYLLIRYRWLGVNGRFLKHWIFYLQLWTVKWILQPYKPLITLAGAVKSLSGTDCIFFRFSSLQISIDPNIVMPVGLGENLTSCLLEPSSLKYKYQLKLSMKEGWARPFVALYSKAGSYVTH